MVIDGCGNPSGATLGDILVARLAHKGVAAYEEWLEAGEPDEPMPGRGQS